MLEKLYLRLWFWCRNICPKHGPMECGFGGGGCFYYCEQCNEQSRIDDAAEVKQKMEEYGKL